MIEVILQNLVSCVSFCKMMLSSISSFIKKVNSVKFAYCAGIVDTISVTDIYVAFCKSDVCTPSNSNHSRCMKCPNVNILKGWKVKWNLFNVWHVIGFPFRIFFLFFFGKIPELIMKIWWRISQQTYLLLTWALTSIAEFDLNEIFSCLRVVCVCFF